MTLWLGSRAYSCLLFLNWYENQYPLGWFTEIRDLKSRKTMHPPLQDVLLTLPGLEGAGILGSISRTYLCFAALKE